MVNKLGNKLNVYDILNTDRVVINNTVSNSSSERKGEGINYLINHNVEI
jgi:hypothetical protein